MGREIASADFSKSDFKDFSTHLRDETEMVASWFADERFYHNGRQGGVELEACLIDRDYNPYPCSENFIKHINDPRVVPELARFNFELNSKPFILQDDFLDKLYQELTALWQTCRDRAKEINGDIVAVGILPTLSKECMSQQNMHDMQRYYALEEQLSKRRNGKPIHIKIDGKERLDIMHESVMMETAATSLQIHVQLNPKTAVRFYNAALIISAPMIAVSANSPFLFGKELWAETRIPVFEQVVNYIDKDKRKNELDRVTFGNVYAKDSLLDLFLVNLNDYEVLLPEQIKSKPEELKHFSLHNGTIWRWNRPIVGLENNGNPHLRIEHRVNATGPTMLDTVANTALFLGLLHYYANMDIPPEKLLPFTKAKDNFYQAARLGLHAKIDWLNKESVPIQTLILDLLLEQAREGLKSIEFNEKQINYYLDDIIKPRVRSMQNGAQWQQQYIAKNGANFNEMLYRYCQQQAQEIPVHEWR